tara:strand:- start:76 stop:1176 length:1101 start_codon:yes stop_codon:yes gene_type:complete
MTSNYRRIGDFIRRISVKNTDGTINNLLGINIDKYFMPSVANVIGTDLTKYKVVKPYQFSCNRMHVGRDERLPVSLSKEDFNFIVSPAYDVFEICKPEELDSDYLMIWFSRAEFDRNAWFYTDSDVRGKLGWDSLCEMELPVPSIDKQKEIVKEYNTVVNRIKLNETLNKKLEETALALYKHWFVDFESKDKVLLSEFLNPKKGKNITRENAVLGEFPVVAGGLNPSCFNNQSNTMKPVVTISASGANAGFVNLYHTEVWASDCSFIDLSVYDNVLFIYCCLKVNEKLLMSKQTGTGQPHIYPEQICSITVDNYNIERTYEFNKKVSPLFYKISINIKQIKSLISVKDMLLSKMSKVESLKTEQVL